MPTTLPLTDPAAAYALALSVGFKFPMTTAGVTHIGPAKPLRNQQANIVRVRQFLADGRNAAAVYALAHPGESGLTTPPNPRCKIGYHPTTGEPLGPGELPPPPPPPPPPQRNSILVDPGSLHTLAAVNKAIDDIETGMRVLQWSLERLPAEHEDEHHETRIKRGKLYGQQRRMCDHRDLLAARRSDLVMEQVDAAAYARAQVDGPTVVTSW